MAEDRIIILDGPTNFRDLGGYLNMNGQSVKWNKIYRSDSLSALSFLDKHKLHKLKVSVDCDLRSHHEKSVAPDRLWRGVKFIDAPVYSEDLSENRVDDKLAQLKGRLPDLSDNFLGQIYQRAILNPHSQEQFKKIFAELLALPEKEALVFHCSAGKDRTGMTAALILMALEVSDDLIAKDYLLTNSLYSFALRKNYPSNDQISNMIAKMNVTKGEGSAVYGITKTIRSAYGDFAGYFKDELGFSKEDLVQLRKMYLE